MSLPNKQVDFISPKGGIDRASNVQDVADGAALDLINFEPDPEGGYTRYQGYERVDGRAAPSDAVYYTVGVADASGISVGATLTGVSSGATSEVVIKSGNTLGVTALSGNYTLAETANGTTITATETLSGQTDLATDATWQLAAEDYYRTQIGAVPGDGDARYAFQYGSTKYAFRADSGAVKLYKSSSSGWTLVPFFDVLFFDAGTLAEGDITEGTTITGATSSATATVKKFIKNDGSYGSTASGYMVIDVTSGTFQDNEKIQVSAVNKADADGTNTAITLSAGGTFQHIERNFYATSTTRYVYGCDGVNPAWEFDGTTLTPIYYSGSDPDPSWNAPTYIEEHRHHLFLTYAEGTVAHSTPGEPLIFNGILGSSEFGIGDAPTGLMSRAGEVLAIYAEGKTYGLYGKDVTDWDLRLISETIGAKPYTVKAMGEVFSLDAQGIAPLTRAQEYGDFTATTVSRRVKKILDAKKSLVMSAVALYERNQYRIYFTDGTALVMTFDIYRSKTSVTGFSMLKFPDAPTFISRSEDASGNEVILFGDSSGYIYQSEIGYNCDGDEMEWVYRTPFLSQGSPHIRKTYRDLFMDIEAERSFTMSVGFDLSFSDYYTAVNNLQTTDFAGGGNYWDVGNWDEFYWDAELYSSRRIPLSGTGKNISLLFYGSSKTIRPFKIQGLELHYIPRRLKRGR